MSELLQLNYFANLFYKLIEWIVSTLSLDIKGILKENEKPKTKEIKSLRSFMKQNSDLNKGNSNIKYYLNNLKNIFCPKVKF